MASIIRNVVRLGVIGTLAGGAVILVAGPHRVAAMANQAKSAINDTIDQNIDDPIALRAQLRTLEAQYPGRIAKVGADLAEVRLHVADMNVELETTQRVVALADSELMVLDETLARAENALSENSFSVVRVRLDHKTLDLSEAYSKATRMQNSRDNCVSQIEELSRDLSFLRDQEQQLNDLHAQLQTEQTEFQGRIVQLDRDIDAITRGDRMITLMEKRQKTIDELERYSAESLAQVTSKIESLKAGQQQRLQALSNKTDLQRWEDIARMEIRSNTRATSNGRGFQPAVIEIQPDVIEITPQASPEPGESVASRLD